MPPATRQQNRIALLQEMDYSSLIPQEQAAGRDEVE